MPSFFILVFYFIVGKPMIWVKTHTAKKYTHEVVMEETSLSAKAVEAQHITAICFYSGLGNGNGGTDFVTRKQTPSLVDVKAAIDNSVTDTMYLKVGNDLNPRRFTYGEHEGQLVLVETCLIMLDVVKGFTPLDMRSASWRKQVQPPVAA